MAKAPTKQPAKTLGRKARPDIVHTSVYLPKAVHQALRQIAFEHDAKIHDVILEGIDAALRKYGHSSVNALRPGPTKKGRGGQGV